MKRLAPLLALFLAAGAAFAETPPALEPCKAVDEFNLHDPRRPETRFTTPPYVALAASGRLKRLAYRSRPSRQEIALPPEQVACLESITGARMTAVRAESTYRYKLQTPAGALLIFHVGDLVGSEAIPPTRVERLLANAERFLAEGNREEATRAYLEVLEAEPRPVEAATAYTALGMMEKEAGQKFKALYHFRKAVEAHPSSTLALQEQAALAMALNQPEEARRANEALTKLIPGRPGPYVALIQLAKKQDDQEEMVRLFSKLQAVDRKAAEHLAYTMPELKGQLRAVQEHAPTVKDVLEIPLGSRPGGTLTVEVSVNGSEPMTFMVDTGASFVSLKEETARRLGIEIDPERRGVFITAKGPQTSFVINIERMEIKGIEAKNVSGTILNQDFGGGVEGLLGQSFLQKINARIDITKKVMIIE